MLLINVIVFKDYDWEFDLLIVCFFGFIEVVVLVLGFLRFKLVGAISLD